MTKDSDTPRRRELPVVAIDGPAGAGKSTVTRRVAADLGYTAVDTGALYRTVALACSRRNVAWDDAAGVQNVAHELAREGLITMTQAGGTTHVTLAGEDVSEAIRTQKMGQGASQVSALPPVRDALLEMQRALGCDGGVVLEGRDIGSVVFPDAEAKFFLTASAEVRAQRRHEELQDRGETVALSEVLREVEERDRRDTERPVAPLVRADDAHLVDSSSLDIDQVVEEIVRIVRGVEAKLREAAGKRHGAS